MRREHRWLLTSTDVLMSESTSDVSDSMEAGQPVCGGGKSPGQTVTPFIELPIPAYMHPPQPFSGLVSGPLRCMTDYKQVEMLYTAKDQAQESGLTESPAAHAVTAPPNPCGPQESLAVPNTVRVFDPNTKVPNDISHLTESIDGIKLNVLPSITDTGMKMILETLFGYTRILVDKINKLGDEKIRLDMKTRFIKKAMFVALLT